MRGLGTTRGLLLLTAVVAVFLALNLAIEEGIRRSVFRRRAQSWEWQALHYSRTADETGGDPQHWREMAMWARLQGRRYRQAEAHVWDELPPAPRMPIPPRFKRQPLAPTP